MPAAAKSGAILGSPQKKQRSKHDGKRQPLPEDRPPNVQRINPLENPIDAVLEEVAAESEKEIIAERPRSWWKKDN